MAAMHGCFLIWFQRMVAMIGFGCVLGVSLFCVSCRLVDTSKIIICSTSCIYIQIEPSPIALRTRARIKLDGSASYLAVTIVIIEGLRASGLTPKN